VHCLDAETGHCYWVHQTGAEVWGSTLVADGKVYLGTRKSFWVLAAGKQRKVLHEIRLGTSVWSTPVAANGVLFVASQSYLWAVRSQGTATN
jgi:outer membrane protein assembly factor BamB